MTQSIQIMRFQNNSHFDFFSIGLFELAKQRIWNSLRFEMQIRAEPKLKLKKFHSTYFKINYTSKPLITFLF